MWEICVRSLFCYEVLSINSSFAIIPIGKRELNALLRSAMAGRLYKLQSKHTSNSGFDQTFMPSSGYVLFAAEQRAGYQIS